MAISVSYMPAGLVGDTIDLAHLAGERASQQQAAQRIEQNQLAYAQMAQQYNLAQQGRADNYNFQMAKEAENARYRDFLGQRDQANNAFRAQLEGFQQQQANQRAEAVQQRMQGTQAAQMMSQQAGQMRTQSNQQFAQLQQAASMGDASAGSLVGDYQKYMQGAQRAYNSIARKYSHDPAKLAQASMALEQKRAEWMGSNFNQWKGSQPLPIENEMQQMRFSPDGSKQLDGKGGFAPTLWEEKKAKALDGAKETHTARTRDIEKSFDMSVIDSSYEGNGKPANVKVPASEAYKSLKQRESEHLLKIDKLQADSDYWEDFEEATIYQMETLGRELAKANRDPSSSQAYQQLESRAQSIASSKARAQDKLNTARMEFNAQDYAQKADWQRETDMEKAIVNIRRGGREIERTEARPLRATGTVDTVPYGGVKAPRVHVQGEADVVPSEFLREIPPELLTEKGPPVKRIIAKTKDGGLEDYVQFSDGTGFYMGGSTHSGTYQASNKNQEAWTRPLQEAIANNDEQIVKEVQLGESQDPSTSYFE